MTSAPLPPSSPNRRGIRFLLPLALSALMAEPSLYAAVVQYPDDAGVIDVTRPPYNADNTGTQDATDAIQQAISDQADFKYPRIIFLPAGTYLLSDTLFWQKFDKRRVPQQWSAMISLVGEDREKTILRLADNLPAFNKDYPKAVIYTANVEGDSGNTAFYNHLRNFTVSIGSGNRMAVGIDWQAHNQGSLRDVTITAAEGSGAIGLDLQRNAPGPFLVKDVSIEGFDWGIITSDATTYACWFEDLQLAHQREGGIKIGNQAVAIRHLSTNLAGPVAVSSPDSKGHLVLLDSTFSGGSPGVAALQLDCPGFLRDISIEGSSYGSFLNLDGKDVAPGPLIREMAFHPAAPKPTDAVVTLFDDAPRESLRLEVVEAPQFAAPPVEEWVNVADFGATPSATTDSSVAIQKAIDSTLPGGENAGKRILYFPAFTGKQAAPYALKNPIVLHGSLEMLQGIGNRLQPIPGGELEKNPSPPLVIDAEKQGTVCIEDLEINTFNFKTGFSIDKIAKDRGQILYTIAHRGPAKLVLRRVTANYYGAEGAGNLFVEDLVGGRHRFGEGQRAWLKHFNAEGYDDFKLRCEGATVWVFGMKCEWLASEILVADGGRVEVLGAFYYPVKETPDNHTAITIKDGEVAWTGILNAWTSSAIHTYFVEEHHQKVIRRLPVYDLPQRESGASVGLFRSGLGTTTEGYEAPADPMSIGNLALTATASATGGQYRISTPPSRANDGNSRWDRSRWVSKSTESQSFELNWPEPVTFSRVDALFITYGSATVLSARTSDGQWKQIATFPASRQQFLQSATFPAVSTSSLRLTFENPKTLVRLQEVGVYAGSPTAPLSR